MFSERKISKLLLFVALFSLIGLANAYVAETELTGWGKTYLTSDWCAWDGPVAVSNRKDFFSINSKGEEVKGCYTIDEKFIHLQVVTTKGVKIYAFPKNQFRFSQ
ncbi:hypothetical protein G6662_06400 [Polynucleobacter paneuropaeus]|jgi:hypothetical protein|uniref:hypothetical protein n=1 Tax=Polynucleobacter paneuropaeus TaxID=2527775 RepID=UPI001BFE05D1|nr:hypothetical protein [Polynucleobacter paneuropaeus]MBT8604203.1 hypothetical protein [Polynucleobacter paneuropaeus]MBT8621981.1 hypothetical protein [Polynucleobacter paneuropaeus]